MIKISSRISLLAGLTLGGLLVLTLAAAAEESAPPSVVVPVIEQPPVIDGKLDDAAWKTAVRCTSFMPIHSRQPAAAPTDLWLMADGQYLYLGVLCHESHLADLVTKVKGRDGAVNQDDSLEIFLDPGTDGKIYFQFLLNAANVQADQLCRGDQRDRDWNGGWRSAVYVDPYIFQAAGWSAEVAIPLQILRRNAGPGEWRLNVCRNKKTSPSEFSTWAPVQGGYHEPAAFGVLTGLKKVTPKAVFAPVVTAARVTPYQIHAGRYSYAVACEMMNDGGQGGEVDLLVNDRPAAGKPAQKMEKLALQPLEKKQLTVAMEIDQPGDRNITVSLKNTATGETLQQLAVADVDKLNPLRAYLDRNYYTGEGQARILAAVTLAETEWRQAGLSVAADLLGEKDAVRESAVKPLAAETVLELPLASVAAGHYPIRVQLRDPQGRVLGQVNLELVKALPAPTGTSEVKLDQVNECLLVNNQPFFPIGICAAQMDEPTLQTYQDIGFNTLIRWWGYRGVLSNSVALESLTAARRHAIYIIENPFSFSPAPTPQGRNMSDLMTKPDVLLPVVQKELPSFVDVVRNHPAVLAYYGLDEASSGSAWDEPLQSFLRTVHELDPYHPVYMSGGVAAGKGRYDYTDIIGQHIYWCSLGVVAGANPNVMARYVQESYDNVTHPNHRPLFIIPQAEITSLSRRPHTPAERRANVYAAIIHGAKSIIYFGAPVRHRQTLENMKELSTELRALAPALLTRVPPQEIAVEPAVFPDGLPIVQAVLKDRPEGDAVLIAANSSPYPVDARWDLSALGPSAWFSGMKVSDLFTGAKYRLSRGILADRLAGYGTRAYVITGATRKTGEKAVIRLVLSGAAVEQAQAALRPKPAPVFSNLLVNADFEAGTSGWTFPTNLVARSSAGRQGGHGLKIVKTATNVAVQIYAPKTMLKPDTAYGYGGWIRTRLTQGETAAGFYLREATEDKTARLTAGLPVGPRNDWTRCVRQIKTPPGTPIPVSYWIQIPQETTGEIWLDDGLIEELPTVAIPKRPKNLLVNSSFEEAALPGWPDSWWFGSSSDKMSGDPGGPGQDGTVAYHGKYSLKMINELESISGACVARSMAPFLSPGDRGGIPVEIGKTYVFSVYLRADRTNVPAEIVLCNFAWNNAWEKEGRSLKVQLTKDWQRFEVSCTIPKEGWTRGTTPCVQVIIRLLGKKCILWADAAQLEEGAQATAYEPDDYRVQP